MTVTSQNAHVKPASFQIDAIESIAWNNREYTRHMVGETFASFISWLVKNDQFEVKIDGREFEVQISYDGCAWTATTSNYDGHNINMAWSFISREHALYQLAEQLHEAILSDRI